MENEKSVIIGRPVNGISINGLEYLLGEHGRVKEFADKMEALKFLKDNKIFDRDVGDYIYLEVETRKEITGKRDYIGNYIRNFILLIIFWYTR
jgi:hypothetical protein